MVNEKIEEFKVGGDVVIGVVGDWTEKNPQLEMWFWMMML